MQELPRREIVDWWLKTRPQRQENARKANKEYHDRVSVNRAADKYKKKWKVK